MKTIEKYKIFLHEKSIDELQFNTSLWVTELGYIDTEVSFIKHLIKSNLIKSKIPNLFENLQLFIKELDSIKDEKNNLMNDVHQYTNQLNGMVECDKLSCDNFYIITYEKLAKEVFNYLQTYKKLKTQIYEYLNGVLS
jgi:hypothetical protein